MQAADPQYRSATISVLVDNESGVLARVIGLFSGRGYNIDSLTVAPVDDEGGRSRINVVTSGTCRCTVSPTSPSRARTWRGKWRW
jgi:acetolactate synthase-1/3 small subunit